MWEARNAILKFTTSYKMRKENQKFCSRKFFLQTAKIWQHVAICPSLYALYDVIM